MISTAGDPIRAAVLVPLRTRGTETSVILTERAAHLSMHAGQVAFPGGRHDPSQDASLVATALRETFEEIGLLETDLEVIGIFKATRHVVHPDIFIPLPTGQELKNLEGGAEAIGVRVEDRAPHGTVG